MKCWSVSNSVNSKTFHFQQQSDFHYHLSIKRVLDPEDFENSIFLILELNHTLHITRINRVDLKKNQIQISIFSPPLPAKKFSISKSSLVFISTNNVIGRLTDAPTQTTTNRIALSDEQFTSNIGGQTSLWIGMSFLSMMELAEMLYRLIQYQFNAIQRTRQIMPQ